MKTYLSVPYEKEEAKEFREKCDSKEKKWYAQKWEKWYTQHEKNVFAQRFSVLPSITKLKGEDKNFEGNRLFVDLVPKSCWFTNVKSCVQSSDWDRLRTFVYERVNNQCECCGEKPSSSLEAHERWQFNYETKTQKLMRIIALCKSCHEVTHIGLSGIRGIFETTKQHLMKVTGMKDSEVEEHIKDAFDLWKERNKFEWNLDLSIITESGIQLAKKVEKKERIKISEEKLIKINCKSNSKRKFDLLAASKDPNVIYQNSQPGSLLFEVEKKRKNEEKFPRFEEKTPECEKEIFKVHESRDEESFSENNQIKQLKELQQKFEQPLMPTILGPIGAQSIIYQFPLLVRGVEVPRKKGYLSKDKKRSKERNKK